MKLAIAAWNGRVSPVLDTARQILVLDFQGDREIDRSRRELRERPLPRRARCLATLEVDALICGAVSRPLENLISGTGLRLVPWVAGEVDEVIRAFLDGRIDEERFRMPGCRPRGRHGAPFGACGRRKRRNAPGNGEG